MARFTNWNMEEFRRIRTCEGIVGALDAMGDEWVESLNAELHEAQEMRRQPVEDGYVKHVVAEGARARLHIVPATARAQAHEDMHHSILRHIPHG